MTTKDYILEYKLGAIDLSPSKLLIEDVEDMEELEYWEDRLQTLEEPFAVAYRKLDGKIKYSIFSNFKK